MALLTDFMALTTYKYVTQRRKGAPYKTNTLSADSSAAAERKLLENEVPVLNIDRAQKARSKGITGKSIPAKDLLLFAQQMESTQKIQMSRLEALDLCIETSQNKTFKLMMGNMRQAIAEGGTLFDAMRRFPRAFDELTLGLVNAGEQSGALDRSFNQIKFIMRRTIRIRKKLIGMMIYPAIVMTIAAGAMFVICWKTVPAFTGLFIEAKIPLPLPTRILVAISDTTIAHPILVLSGIGLFLGAIWNLPVLYRRVPATHKWVLRLPVIATLQKRLIQATFARTLAQMMEAQMPLLNALMLCRSVSNNYEFRASIARGTIKVSKGNSMMHSFEQEKDILSTLLVRVLGFGERTGRTEDVLNPLAESLDEAADEYIDHLKTALEPMLTLLIGGVVLLIMLALFIPIFSLPTLIK